MKAIQFILVFGLSGLLLPGCATTPPRSTAAAPASSQKDPAHASAFATGNADAFAHYAAGESYLNNADPAGMARQWEASALADPSNESLVIQVTEELLEEKENDRALALLTKSAARPDASAVILSWLSRVQLAANHPRQALATSKLAIQRAPGMLDGYGCQLEVLFHDKNWPEADKTLHRAARDIRPEPNLLMAVADLFGEYLKAMPKDSEAEASAVALLDRAAQCRFTNPRLWERLADSYARFNKEPRAIEILNRLLEENPNASPIRDELHQKLAGIYIQTNDRTNATKQLQALVSGNPNHYPRAWFVLGELAYEGTNFVEAAEDFANALMWDQTIEQAYYDLALVQLELHRDTEAFETLDKAQRHFAKTFGFEFYSGVAYARLKKFDQAIPHFKEAEVIAEASDRSKLDQRFYFQFGAACERAKDFKNAETYLQKSVTLAPDFAEGLNYLGYMLADRGEQLGRARELIEKALNLEPTNGAFLDSFGWVLLKQNQPRQALPQLLKAIQYTTPPDATVFDHLGEVYLALHEVDKAVDSWKKSFSIEPNDEVKRKLEQYSTGSL